MAAATHTLTLPGAMLERGFWLYVWRVETPVGEYLYVGRTGDNSSPNASAPYQRMGQHLGRQKNQNALRKHLDHCGIVPEHCKNFHLITYGPLFEQAVGMDDHEAPRDVMAALEKALADTLKTAGYQVMNKVYCRKPLDKALFTSVREAFAKQLPKLQEGRGRA